MDYLLCPGPECNQKYSNEKPRMPYLSSSCDHSLCYTCACRANCIICFPLNNHRIHSSPSDFWRLNKPLLGMIRFAEENEEELKKQSLLEKTNAIQEMERENIEKIEELEREKNEMREQCRLAEEEKENELRRAEDLSARVTRAESELSELKKCEMELPNAIDYIECVDCKEMYRREKMKICVECMDDTKEEMMRSGEKITDISSSLPIICGFCVLKKHFNHTYIDYLPYKIREMFSSDVAYGKETAQNNHKECTKKMEMGYECMEKWIKEMDKFVDKINFGGIAYRDSLTISSSLRNESDDIHNAAHEILSVLEEFTLTIQESSSRLSDLLETLPKNDETVDKE